MISNRSIISFEQQPLRLILTQTLQVCMILVSNAPGYINSTTVNENQSHGVIS